MTNPDVLIAKAMLKPLTVTVPQGILTGGSVQVTRAWKALAAKAQKALDSDRSTAEQLRRLFFELSQYK